MYWLLDGDALQVLRGAPDRSVQCVATSPPYWGLRDYGSPDQIGLEPTPEEYVAKMVAVFREVRRVLRDDGVCWLNLGDSFTSGGRTWREADAKNGARAMSERADTLPGLKPKDLVGIPWRVAFALQADGWWLRQDIIWAKPNPMPESVTDRCTKSHEYVFMLTKSARYFYAAGAIAEPCVTAPKKNYSSKKGILKQDGHGPRHAGFNERYDFEKPVTTRNARSVWTISTKPFKEAHFAVFPPELAERCVLAGSKPGDIVLDPFSGAGTTGLVALQHRRDYIGIEINPEYNEMARRRIEAALKRTP